VNLTGATNTTLTLTNVQAAQAVDYTVTVSNEVGTITSTNAHLYLVAPPTITSQSPLPTNQVCIYGNVLSFNVMASAPGQFAGFPLSYQWTWNGTNISNATNSAYSLTADDDSSGTYSVLVANAVGSTNASWQVTVTNVINATKDLLLIYNTNSTNSIVVKDYYLAHRPMVTGANVLGITCTTEERISGDDFTNQLAPQVGNWLATNATKHPQYIILFPDIPSRVWSASNSEFLSALCSVSYGLSTNFTGYRPFLTSINMGLCFGGTPCDNLTNDCIAYINKLEQFASNYSPGQLFISAGVYGNTNYIVDDVHHEDFGFADNVSRATNGLLSAQVSPAAIRFRSELEPCINGLLGREPAPDFACTNGFVPKAHLTNAVNVAGYICWGVHSTLGNTYSIDDDGVKWGMNSGWWIIETTESFNGWRGIGHGNFTQWFSATAFGGTNYSNTPVGAVSHTDEPHLIHVNDSALYFGLWAKQKSFAIAAWVSRDTQHFQAVGDPFVIK